MILKEMMLDSLQGKALTLQGSTTASAQEKSDGVKPVFSDVLSSKVKAKVMDDVDSRRNNAAGDRKEVKTFREISSKVQHEAKKPVVNEKTEAGDDPVKEKDRAAGKEINHGTAESLMNCFAQVLGLDPGEFRKLMQAAGISPEELVNVSDTAQLTAKLTAVLGLNQEQSGVLNDILEMVKAQIQTQTQTQTQGVNSDLAGQTIAANTADNTEDAAQAVKESEDSPQIEIVKMTKDPESELTALTVKMKLKLNELRDRLKDGKEELAGEISGKLEANLKGTGGSAEKNAEIQSTEAVKAESPIVPADANRGNTDGSKEGKAEKKADASEVKPAETVTLAANDDNGQLTVPGAGQLQKADEIFQVEKLSEKTPVQAKELINQVLEKAKVVITGDKSEMVMDLKPDSLGKLSLKVVTEHGIVMAKFVAENQQVKQVLESNMQLLKDSLEKQGMNVQGFSVSVRQDSRQGYGGQNETGSSERLSNRKALFGTERLTAAIDKIAAVERHNPYSISTSTVNFTA